MLLSMKKSYSTDLTNTEWEYLEPLVEAPNKRGRPKTHLTCRILHKLPPSNPRSLLFAPARPCAEHEMLWYRIKMQECA